MSRVYLLWGDAEAASYDGGPDLLSIHATKESAEKEKARLERTYRRARRKLDADQPLTDAERDAYYTNNDFDIEQKEVKP